LAIEFKKITEKLSDYPFLKKPIKKNQSPKPPDLEIEKTSLPSHVKKYSTIDLAFAKKILYTVIWLWEQKMGEDIRSDATKDVMFTIILGDSGA
jgi:hypothetical protein